jgi:hypothetical protein
MPGASAENAAQIGSANKKMRAAQRRRARRAVSAAGSTGASGIVGSFVAYREDTRAA